MRSSESALSSYLSACFDRFANVRESFCFGAALRQTTRQSRAFRDDEPGFVAFEGHQKLHNFYPAHTAARLESATPRRPSLTSLRSKPLVV